jgi:hypothetical protein
MLTKEKFINIMKPGDKFSLGHGDYTFVGLVNDYVYYLIHDNDYGTRRTKLEHVLKYFSNHKKEIKTESKWVECELEEATGLRNSEGEVRAGKSSARERYLIIDGRSWADREIEFAKLTPVKEVQVEVLPEWVTNSQAVFFIDPAHPNKYCGTTIPCAKRKFYNRGFEAHDTKEEAIAAADAQITRNLAERDGKIVKVQKWFGSAVIDVVRIAHDQFASKCVEITIREVKDL